jgi:sugar lactone lactonase YvrE
VDLAIFAKSNALAILRDMGTPTSRSGVALRQRLPMKDLCISPPGTTSASKLAEPFFSASLPVKRFLDMLTFKPDNLVAGATPIIPAFRSAPPSSPGPLGLRIPFCGGELVINLTPRQTSARRKNSATPLTIASALALLCCLASAWMPAYAATHTVSTYAGGYVGDGKRATAASFANPLSVARDTKGNLYVSDSNDCRIRKINTGGIISAFAGTGICGYSGDGGLAASAMLSSVYGIAFDGHGNLLLADQGNNRIRQITPAGIITTIAGNGTFGYFGDGGPATQAMLGAPTSISPDGTGNLYIADSSNYVIRMVDTAGNIHTVAGNHVGGFSGDGGSATSAQISFVEGVLADRFGNFYIADTGNLRVRKVDSSGTINTFAGDGQQGNTGSGGTATSANIGYPYSLLLSAGKLYIGTAGNIWGMNLSTQIINIVAGNANGAGGFSGDGNVATATSFSTVWGLAAGPSGAVLVPDSGNNRVRQIAGSTQLVSTLAGGYIGDGGKATSASLDLYRGHIAFDPAGNMYIADVGDNRVRKVSPAGMITTFAGTGITGYTGDGGPAASATLSTPSAVAADSNGNVFIADAGNTVIRKVDSSDTITTFSNVFLYDDAAALATDANGNLYVADGLFAVWKVTPSGVATVVAGVPYQLGYNGDGIAATQALLNFPYGVAVDSAGNLYISDWLNQRIRKVDTSGIISTVAGTGIEGFSGDGGPATSAELNLPEDVAVDRSGNLYIADWVNFRVRVVNSAGTINTLAGSGGFGYNGDGLPATQTNLFPLGLAISNGVVYVTDQSSYRVRAVH